MLFLTYRNAKRRRRGRKEWEGEWREGEGGKRKKKIPTTNPRLFFNMSDLQCLHIALKKEGDWGLGAEKYLGFESQ